MDIHAATEEAYKNGYKQAILDFYEQLTETDKSIDTIMSELFKKHNI